jgi:hypothetical protein
MGLNMKEMGQVSSLIPYLDATNGNFYLRFSLISQDHSLLEKTFFPFLVVMDSDPLARLIEAHCVTDAGSEIRKVFVLVQRDQYLLRQNDLWPIQNPEIVESWQKSFSFYEKEKSGSFIMLSGQVNDQGGLQAFSSLFYCKKRKIYFSPPCPKCGSLLQQCGEDQRLSRSGLQPYSTSLKRYLFCPSCDDSGNSDFYTYELGPLDPPALKDRWGLMKDLGRAPAKGVQRYLFPCADCPDHPACFGSEHFVLSRMVPFSFYPFFMLIFDSMSLHALDFLSLLSGATFDEIETSLKAKHELGRINCLKIVHQNIIKKVPLLFDRGEKHFLEVLYLKLSFLGEVLQDIFSRKDGVGHPDLRLSIDRCWIKLADHGTLLPFLWDFKVRFIDLCRRTKETPFFPKLPDSYALYDLGLFWFYALLVNQKQDISKIYTALGMALDQSFSDSRFSFGTFLKESPSPIFFPKNIFWDPGKREVKPDWHFLWERALDLGWSLLRTGMEKGSSWSEELFRKQWEDLREEVKSHLFVEEPFKKEVAPPSPSKTERAFDGETGIENEAIHKILMKILERWRSKSQPEEEDLGETRFFKQPPITQENISDTETLPPFAFRSKPRSEGEEKVFSKETKKEEESQATEIISPFQKKKKIEVIPKIEKQPEEEEFIAETVIIKPRKSRNKEKDEQDG